MSDFYDKMSELFKEDTAVFYSENSIELRKKIDYYSSLIDRLNYQLFIASKKYAEVMHDYRKLVGLPVKEVANDKTQTNA